MSTVKICDGCSDVVGADALSIALSKELAVDLCHGCSENLLTNVEKLFFAVNGRQLFPFKDGGRPAIHSTPKPQAAPIPLFSPRGLSQKEDVVSKVEVVSAEVPAGIKSQEEYLRWLESQYASMTLSDLSPDEVRGPEDAEKRRREAARRINKELSKQLSDDEKLERYRSGDFNHEEDPAT